MTEQVQQTAGLELADIANATQIMKAAIERGVFRAEEMSGVAGVFDKFNAFLAQIEAQQKAQAQAEADAEAAVEKDAE